MKEKRVLGLLLFAVLLLIPLCSAGSGNCNLSISMTNQDPYPAIPGDYVRLVFQVSDIDNTDCGIVTLRLNEEFPFSLDPEAQKEYSTDSFFDRNYQSFLIAPYKLRVDKEAVDGANPIEVVVSASTGSSASTLLKKFDIEVEDKRTNFEVYVKNYDPLTNILTLEILNIGKPDVRAVTIAIPNQNSITIKGPNVNVVGDLDSNEYTTADFEATSKGGKINLDISYTDAIDVRRTSNVEINFDPSYFSGRKSQQKSYTWVYILIIIIIVAAVFIYRRFKKKQKKVY